MYVFKNIKRTWGGVGRDVKVDLEGVGGEVNMIKIYYMELSKNHCKYY